MNIESAQYVEDINPHAVATIKARVDGQDMFIPCDPANRHYAEILKQVQEGTLTIQDAD